MTGAKQEKSTMIILNTEGVKTQDLSFYRQISSVYHMVTMVMSW